MELIGEIVALQVQRSSLKLGERPHRWYDPAPLQAVTELELDPGGVHGRDARGGWHRDVHHAAATNSRNRDGRNGVSIGFTSHYQAMRARFGEGIELGCAGENILVSTARRWDLAALQPALLVVNPDGSTQRLQEVIVAEPCVEFTRFLLHLPPETVTDGRISTGLRFLGAGTRGYYATYTGPPARIAAGARVYVA